MNENKFVKYKSIFSLGLMMLVVLTDILVISITPFLFAAILIFLIVMSFDFKKKKKIPVKNNIFIQISHLGLAVSFLAIVLSYYWFHVYLFYPYLLFFAFLFLEILYVLTPNRRR